MNFSNYLPELPSGRSVVVALMLAPFTSLLATSSWAQAAPKYAGKVPASVTTPDTVQTRIGTLRFADGAPDEATVQKAYQICSRILMCPSHSKMIHFV